MGKSWPQIANDLCDEGHFKPDTLRKVWKELQSEVEGGPAVQTAADLRGATYEERELIVDTTVARLGLWYQNAADLEKSLWKHLKEGFPRDRSAVTFQQTLGVYALFEKLLELRDSVGQRP